MGFAVRNLQTGLFRAWARWEAPAIDPEVEEVVEMDEAPTISPDTSAVPPSITRWQGRRWLLAAGLFADVEAMIAAAGDAARIDYGVETWYRANPLFETLASALFQNDTQEQVIARVDQMFREASQILG